MMASILCVAINCLARSMRATLSWLLMGLTRPRNEGSAAMGAGSFADGSSTAAAPIEGSEAAAAADTHKNERREIMLAPVTKWGTGFQDHQLLKTVQDKGEDYRINRGFVR
jgi:hypothetical protein